MEDKDSKVGAVFTHPGSIYSFSKKLNISLVNATDVGHNLTDFEVVFRFTAITDEVSLTCVGSSTHGTTLGIKRTIKVHVFSKLVLVSEIDIKAFNNSCRQTVYI